MRALIFGASGQLGRELIQVAPPDLQLSPASRSDADLERVAEIDRLIADVRPDLIVNAAAYTAVDRAEEERELAYAINAAAPAAMAKAAAKHGARLVHVSSDYVFDGTGQAPYRTDESVAPINVYGASKAKGEELVAAIAPGSSVIVRTSWLYSRHGHNFVLTMLSAMRRRVPLRVVADQTGAPTWARTLAQAIWSCGGRHGCSGIVHWTDAGRATWYEFAAEIARVGASLGLLAESVELQPIRAADYPLATPRPVFSVLDISRTGERVGLQPVPWQSALRTMLEEINIA